MRLPRKLLTENGLQQLLDYRRVNELLDNAIASSRRTIFSECMSIPARCREQRRKALTEMLGSERADDVAGDVMR